MYVSARERKIIEILMMNPDEVTIKRLADELDVSLRTVHRDLKGVEDILINYGLSLNKKPGSGIKIVGDDENKEKLQLFLYSISPNDYTPEERQTIILSSLLDSKEPVKLISLANDLNVTIATISNDLNKVEKTLESFGLFLVRRRGYGVEIKGDETSKRKVMSHLITHHLDEFQIMSIIKENIQKRSSETMDTITNKLLGLIDKKKLLIIEKQIKKNLPYKIADSSYIGLVVHLALAIERIQHGEEINFDAEVLENLKDTKEFEVAEKIVLGLEDVLHISIPHEEIGYITMHLMGAKLRNNHEDFLEDTYINIGIIIQNLVKFVSENIGFDLTKDLSLFQGLVAHLRPALFRIKQNMEISNPLLPKIQEDYAELFSIVQTGVAKTFPELQIPKEEIGYLVMHFASAILNRDVSHELKALVVCSSGIGTSKILSTRLEHEIPGLKTQNISLFELDSISRYNYDVIVSTVPLKDFNEEYTLVSPLLTRQEVELVKHSLANNKKVEPDIAIHHQPVKTTSSNPNEFLVNMENVMLYSTSIVQIMKGFQLKELQKPLTLSQALAYGCEKLEEDGVISNSQEVLKILHKREEVEGLGIPGTSLALYHTRSDYVLKPSFTVYRLYHPINVKAMDGSAVEVNTILLMLSPMDVNDETIEVLSSISSLIIRDERSIEKFQSGSKEELYTFLISELNELFESKANNKQGW